MNKHPNHPDNAPRGLIGYLHWHSTSYKRCTHLSCQAKVARIESAGWQVASAIALALVIAGFAAAHL